MAIATTLRRFNDLGRSETPIFLGSFSLPIFYVLRKTEENLSSRSFNLLQNAPSNSVHLTCSFSRAAVSNASSKGLRFEKMMPIFKIINATDSLIQNIIINLSKSDYTPYLWNEAGDPQFLLSVCSRSLKKIFCCRTRTSLKYNQWGKPK